jgi:4-carboxymuconolactone decarboxylase
MARVPLIDEDHRPDLSELIGKIKSARRGRLINVYRLLLNSPPLAETWFAHNNAVRWNTELDGRLREMVIIRIGYVTQVEYVIRQHVPTLAAAEGLTALECNALIDWRVSTLFSDRDRAVLAYADAMTGEIKVPEEVFAGLKPFFTPRQIVDLTVLVGTYNMHARVFQALEIDPESRS